MSNYRHATLLPSESCASAATKTVDLDVTDPISVIQIVMKTTPAGTVATEHPAANITKIELIDGSTVITSLSGKEVQALDFYNTGVMPDNFVSDITGVMAFTTFNLRFGRKLWDRDFALDPTKFSNPQLKITHNYRVADTAASAASLEVYAHMFDDRKISPVGYLRAAEHFSYTNGTSASVETIDLPRDLPIRKMLIRSALDDNRVWQCANKIKIKENGGAKIPYDFTTSAWLKSINQAYPMAIERFGQANAGASRVLYCAPNFTALPVMTIDTGSKTLSQPYVNEAPPLHLVAEASGTISGAVMGFNPHSTFPIPFGDQDDMNDWFEVGKLGSLKMEVTAGTAGNTATTQIVLEQLKRY